MLNPQNKRKIKNDKINCWSLEFSCYSSDIVFHPGKDNIANTFCRVYCLAVNTDTLYQLHNSLCHSGIMRMLAFICSQNLPFSVDDVRKMTKSCQICNECKPYFYSSEPTKLIKTTQPMGPLFKGISTIKFQQQIHFNHCEQVLSFSICNPMSRCQSCFHLRSIMPDFFF